MSYGIGVIGVGVWGCHSLENALVQAADARVVAVANDASMGAANHSSSPEKVGAAYAARFGAAFRSDWRDVMDDPAVDIVSAMVCPRRKAEIILAALAAGKHVVTDKPLAFTVAEAGAIVAAERASAGVGFMLCGYHPRPLVARLLAAIAEGRLGQVRAASVRLHFMGGIYPGFQPSEQWRDEIPSAEMTTIGSHALVTLSRLVGRPAESVHTIARNCFYGAYQAVGAEDWAELSLAFPDAVGQVTVGRLPYRLPREDIRIEVTGTRGYAEIADNRLAIWPGGETLALPVDGGAILDEQFRSFYRTIESGSPPPTSFAEGLDLQRLLAAALHSARTGQPCSVAHGPE